MEYPIDLEFYNVDEAKALSLERTYVTRNPLEMIEACEAQGEGTFTTSTEAIKDEAK